MENQENQYITIVSSDQKEHKCRIIFTYYSKEFDHNYVVFQVDDTEEISAMIFVEKDSTSGELQPIENDEEWNMLEGVLEQYFESQEHEHSCGCGCGCGHDHDECDCDCDCDHDCDCNCDCE